MRAKQPALCRRGLAVLLVLLLALCPAGIRAETYHTLKNGSKGNAVLRLKERLHELGYILFDDFTNQYDNVTREYIITLQQVNGLTPDGIATPELQAFIYSEACLPKPVPVPSSALPPPAGENPPLLDTDGYLAPGQAPYLYASREEGAWTYVDADVRVEVRRYADEAIPRIWLEASIRVRDPARFTAMVNRGAKAGSKSIILSMPTTIAEKNRAVFAFSDDFFGYRLYNRQAGGIVIRNGFVWSDKTRSAAAKTWPPLDVLAIFGDGSMKTFVSDAHTPQEYLDMGAVSTLAFGPILVQDGVLCEDVKNWNGTDRQPRMALGITADGTIRVLDVLGRRTDSRGASIPWIAEQMVALGCVEALNLDGGNTTCMIFNGEIINRELNVKAKDIRTLNAMMGVTFPEEETENTEQ